MILASGIEVAPEAIAELCRRYRVRELALFGSAVRGDMHANSDIDVMVEFEQGCHPGIRLFDFEDELAGLLGRRVDVSLKSLLKPPVRRYALREALTLYHAA